MMLLMSVVVVVASGPTSRRHQCYYCPESRCKPLIAGNPCVNFMVIYIFVSMMQIARGYLLLPSYARGTHVIKVKYDRPWASPCVVSVFAAFRLLLNKSHDPSYDGGNTIFAPVPFSLDFRLDFGPHTRCYWTKVQTGISWTSSELP